MTVTTKYTAPGGAGVEIDARATRYVAEHQGSTYQEAVHAVLSADKKLAEAYGQPATRRVRMATTDKRSQPAVPITPGDEAEITDWVMRAITDGKAGSLPGALGSLAIEADTFKKLGMPAQEAARRAMDSNPHLVALAKLLLADVRRNRPEGEPVADGETLVQDKPGDIVHLRATALAEKHPHLGYSEAMGAVLSEDPALKARYAGVQR